MHRIPIKLNILNCFAFERSNNIDLSNKNFPLHSPPLDYLDNLFEI